MCLARPLRLVLVTASTVTALESWPEITASAVLALLWAHVLTAFRFLSQHFPLLVIALTPDVAAVQATELPWSELA